MIYAILVITAFCFFMSCNNVRPVFTEMIIDDQAGWSAKRLLCCIGKEFGWEQVFHICLPYSGTGYSGIKRVYPNSVEL